MLGSSAHQRIMFCPRDATQISRLRFDISTAAKMLEKRRNNKASGLASANSHTYFVVMIRHRTVLMDILIHLDHIINYNLPPPNTCFELYGCYSYDYSAALLILDRTIKSTLVRALFSWLLNGNHRHSYYPRAQE